MEFLVLPFAAVLLGFLIDCVGNKVVRLALLATVLLLPGMLLFLFMPPNGEERAYAISLGIPFAVVWSIAAAVSFMVAQGRRQQRG